MPVWLIVLIGCLVLAALFFILGNMCSNGRTPFDSNTDVILDILCLVLVIIFGVGSITGPLVVGELERNYDYVEYENIYSIRSTDDDVDGRFFLGSGHIDENSYYIVFVEDEKGIRMNKYDTRFTYIVEVDDGNHYVRRVKEKWDWCDCYYLYVPIGTIIVEYRI